MKKTRFARLTLGLFLLSLTAYSTGLHAAVTEADDDDEGDVASSTSEINEPSGRVSETITGNVGLTSDYVYRGITQTEHGPALQGGLDWISKFGMYVGAWGSNVHSAESQTALELDVYAGYDFAVAKHWKLGTGVIYYAYFKGAEGNNWAIPLKLSWKNFKAELNFTPKQGNVEGDAWYASIGVENDLVYDFTLGLSAGYSMFAPAIGNLDYADFRVALSRELLTVNWELAGTFVSRRQFNGADDPRIILSAAKSF